MCQHTHNVGYSSLCEYITNTSRNNNIYTTAHSLCGCAVFSQQFHLFPCMLVFHFFFLVDVISYNKRFFLALCGISSCKRFFLSSCPNNILYRIKEMEPHIIEKWISHFWLLHGLFSFRDFVLYCYFAPLFFRKMCATLLHEDGGYVYQQKDKRCKRCTLHFHRL